MLGNIFRDTMSSNWFPRIIGRGLATLNLKNMVTKLHVDGFDAFIAEVGKHSNKDVYVLFCGTKDKDGKSWCPDCVVGEI